MAERVLIVDGDAVQRRLLEGILRQAGYETASVDSGEAALQAMLATAGTSYDCVVLDLTTQKLKGLCVLSRMREIGLQIPVIVQTTSAGVDDVLAAMRAGAYDIVVKSVDFERLLVSLRNAVTTRLLTAEIARLNPTGSGCLGFDFNAGRDRRIPPHMHATLAPIDDAGAQQLCESTESRASIEAPLFLGDYRRPEHFSISGAPADGSTLNLLSNDGNVR